MSRDKNHMKRGHASLSDLDLVETQQSVGVYLPWLLPILEEVQHLRDTETYGEAKHYMNILDKLGADYNEY